MRFAFAAFALCVAGCVAPATQAAKAAEPSRQRAPEPPHSGFRVICLGAAQDAGYPHLGCEGSRCSELRAAGLREPVAALAVQAVTGWWLVDATPDLPEQIHRMGTMPQGILLTHAHIGHYTGLMYLGREGIGERRMPVHCSEKMASFLRDNAPWSQLVELENIVLVPFQSGDEIRLDPGLLVIPVEVPHRNEFTDTHAFRFRTSTDGAAGLLYAPDMDHAKWMIGGISDPVAVIDGSFYSAEELPGRDMSEVPHPPVETLMREVLPIATSRLQPHTRFWFTHLNHTNPMWDPYSAAAADVIRHGHRIARVGDVLYESASTEN